MLDVELDALVASDPVISRCRVCGELFVMIRRFGRRVRRCPSCHRNGRRVPASVHPQRITTEAPLTATPDGWVRFDSWPILTVQIRRSDADTGSADLPAPHTPLRVDMLVDTGSHRTCFDPIVFGHIGVRSTGAKQGVVHDGDMISYQDIYVLDLAVFPTVPTQPYLLLPHFHVFAQPTHRYEGTQRPHQGILGINVLEQLRFTLDGPRHIFKLEQPAP